MDSYAVLWSGPGGKIVAGKLELETICLRFAGSSSGQPAAHDHRIPYEDIESVHVGHGAERLGGRPALVLDLDSGPVRISSLDGVGTLIELAAEIGELKAAGAAV